MTSVFNLFTHLTLILLSFVPLLCWAQLQQLLSTIQQNPALLSSLQSNPELLRTLLSSGALSAQLANSQQPRRPKRPTQLEDQCLAVKKQNKLLRQMVLAVAGEDSLNQLDILAPVNNNRPRENLIDPAALLLKQANSAPVQPSISLKSELVTPAATWTTSMTTTSYVTTVTHTETSEVPIILRGKKLVTTILEEDVQTVTATEIKTSSILVTPEPTWKIETITIQPTKLNHQAQGGRSSLVLQTNAPNAATNLQEQFLFNNENLDLDEILRSFNQNANINNKGSSNRNNIQNAEVVEINQPRNFKEAYGAFFANSAQRSAERFGDVLRPVRNPVQDQDIDYFDLDFDQQVLAAQNRPVFVQSPNKVRRVKQQRHQIPTRVPKSKMFTLYFSGTAPGDFSTKVTRLPVDRNGQPILSRNKRSETEDSIIDPSRVQPILSTEAPDFNPTNLDSNFIISSVDDEDDDDIIDDNMMLFSSLELQSSKEPVTVTVTQTVTESCSK